MNKGSDIDSELSGGPDSGNNSPRTISPLSIASSEQSACSIDDGEGGGDFLNTGWLDWLVLVDQYLFIKNDKLDLLEENKRNYVDAWSRWALIELSVKDHGSCNESPHYDKDNAYQVKSRQLLNQSLVDSGYPMKSKPGSELLSGFFSKTRKIDRLGRQLNPSTFGALKAQLINELTAYLSSNKKEGPLTDKETFIEKLLALTDKLNTQAIVQLRRSVQKREKSPLVYSGMAGVYVKTVIYQTIVLEPVFYGCPSKVEELYNKAIALARLSKQQDSLEFKR